MCSTNFTMLYLSVEIKSTNIYTVFWIISKNILFLKYEWNGNEYFTNINYVIDILYI